MDDITAPPSLFRDEFVGRVHADWLPAYCKDPKRGYALEGFRGVDNRLTEEDARDCLRAFDCGVVTFGERQRLKMSHGMASETLFWEHEKNVTPRAISLWFESVITVAAAGRLHLDYGWPAECLGIQSKDSAFDVMAFKPPDFVNEHVAVEVKKSSREVDQLIANLTRCCAGEHSSSCETGSRKNAHRKWVALQARRPALFWAVGPSPASRLLEVRVLDDRRVALLPVTEEKLRFRDPPKSVAILNTGT